MILKLEDIFDYSFLSFALILSLFIDNINGMLSFLTFDFVSDLLSSNNTNFSFGRFSVEIKKI